MSSRFNWWRRIKKQRPLTRKEALKGKSFLLQQIEHGDLDYSDYLRQAMYELVLCDEEKQVVSSKWKGGEDSLKNKLDEIERKYIKRYNRLMDDHNTEEQRILGYLRTSLQHEFGVDVWEEALNSNPDQDLKDFYFCYRELAAKKVA